MSIGSGSLIYFKVDDSGSLKTVVAEISSELSFTSDMIETTNKDTVDSSSQPVKTFIAGEQGFTFSVEGLYDPAGDWNISQILAKIKSGTACDFTFGGTVAGDAIFSGTGLFSSLTLSAAKNEAPTVSAEVQGTGELIEGTVS